MVRERLPWILILLVVVWLYKSFIPPPPKICGTPGGPPITGPRIVLRDGRHLSYEEYGVPKEIAKYKIIYIHGHSTIKNDPLLEALNLFEEFHVYIVGFDRPGYGESDPDPKRTFKSTSLDIEELGDHLKLGTKFYIMGYSAGGALGWGCLKYIPHRLAGIILIAPGFSFWWPSLPSTLVEEAFYQQDQWIQWNILIAHYTPWFIYWWNTQDTHKLFPPSNATNSLRMLSDSDQIMDNLQEYSTQQGLYESYLRDGLVLFGDWGFDALNLENPFVGMEGLVHIWQGDRDEDVSVEVQRYIVNNLPWIHYHEVPNVGHKFAFEDDIKYQIFKRQKMRS
ncbi:hypothetical protein Leryth_016807 [Lithospermum erythrorhizon]|nr:hypothetical protein Leryth_016807 [Lithospermum erythrorhizon]